MAHDPGGTRLDDAVGQLVRALEAPEGPDPRDLGRIAATLLDDVGEDRLRREAERAALLAASFVGVVAPGAARRLATSPSAVAATWRRSDARRPARATRRHAVDVAVTALATVCALTDGAITVEDARRQLRARGADESWDSWTLLHGIVALRAMVELLAGERACDTPVLAS